MRVGDRDLRRILAAPAHGQHWRAFARTWSTFQEPAAAITRYLSNRGSYPWQVTLRTPLGPQRLTLASRHDLLTVNEIFCRRDYGSRPGPRVVDIGANVGFATLFFVTRSVETHVWAFEPDPENIIRLRENLRGFEPRYTLSECAVTVDEVCSTRFVPAGRYGHVARAEEGGIEVPAVPIARALRQIGASAGLIDLVKIDTEGTEEALVAAIPPDVAIREIRYEGKLGRVVTIKMA